MKEIAEVDKKILDILQNNFPISTRPFMEIASQLNITENELLLRIKAMQDLGLIRRLGGIMDSRTLGYYSTLCACTVPEGKIEEVAAFINGYQSVTHNYLRQHHYNMWFTLTAPSQQEALSTIKEIQDLTGLTILSMPAKKVYKIKVSFEMENGNEI